MSMSSLVMGEIKTARTFHKSLLWGVMRSPISFFDTTPIGRILNRFSKDIESLDSDIASIIEYVLYFGNLQFSNDFFYSGYIFCFMHVISTIVLIIYKLPIISALILPFCIVYYYISNYFVATSRQLQRLESVTKSPVFSHFSETLSGIATIRAYNVQKRFMDEMSKRTDSNIQCFLPR